MKIWFKLIIMVVLLSPVMLLGACGQEKQDSSSKQSKELYSEQLKYLLGADKGYAESAEKDLLELSWLTPQAREKIPMTEVEKKIDDLELLNEEMLEDSIVSHSSFLKTHITEAETEKEKELDVIVQDAVSKRIKSNDLYLEHLRERTTETFEALEKSIAEANGNMKRIRGNLK